MVHPNIVAVYSITLRPQSAPAPPPQQLQPGSGSSGNVLMLDQGPATAAAAAAAGGGCGVSPQVVAGAAELLPWEMQLVMEYCDQVGWACRKCACVCRNLQDSFGWPEACGIAVHMCDLRHSSLAYAQRGAVRLVLVMSLWPVFKLVFQIVTYTLLCTCCFRVHCARRWMRVCW
jgi:hypothetical protein